jgi:hypothetical protein
MKVVRLSGLRTGTPLPPEKYSWYSLLLEAESTPGPQCGKIISIKKFKWHHRESNPQPSGAMPQPTAPPLTPDCIAYEEKNLWTEVVFMFQVGTMVGYHGYRKA